MATAAAADIIEPAEPNNSSDNDVGQPALRRDRLRTSTSYSRPGARNLDQILRGENHNIPPSPVGNRVLYMAAVCAFSGLISGAVLVSVGVVISGLVGFHAGKNIPPLWWCGIMPFLVSMAGIHMLVKRNRTKIYHWGLGMLVISLLQTCIMGWLGNFSTSKYDAWPPTKIDSVCRRFSDETMCFCIDDYHGVYSLLQLPGVKYIIIGANLSQDATKWRETMFSDCAILKLVSMLYFVCMGAWGVFLLAAAMACSVAHAGSVCAHVGRREFERLREAAESRFVLTSDDLERLSLSNSDSATEATVIPAIVHVEHVTVA